MKTISNMKFDTSIRVLFELKELKGHKTLQETYEFVGDQGNMLDVLLMSYNLANNTTLGDKGLQEVFATNNVGIIKMISIYGEVVEDLMFDGTTPEERKKVMALAENQHKK